MDSDMNIDMSDLEDSTAGDAVKGLVGLNLLADKRARTGEEQCNSNFRTECKFDVDSFKMIYVINSEGVLYRRLSLCRAKQSHKKVSLKLDKHFHSWHKKWLKDNVSEEDTNKCQTWLLGQTEDSRPTSCVKIENLTKPPYACFNRYRAQEKT